MSDQRGATIRRLVVENYRSLGKIDITLEPLCVLVGANGAGKTNLLDALRFVRDAVTRSLPTAISDRRGMTAIRRWSPDKSLPDVHIQIFLAGDQWSGDYGFTISSSRRATYRVIWEKLSIRKDATVTNFETREGKWTAWPSSHEQQLEISVDQIAIPDNALLLPNLVQLLFPSLTDVFRFLRSMSFYGLSSDAYRRPQAPADPYPLEEDGRNLASVLRHLKETNRHGSIVEAVGNVTPNIADYTVQQIGGYLVTRLQHTPVDGARTGPSFEIEHESAGTLHLLALLAALYQDPPRALVALEEPDTTLHERALGVLADVLREANLRSQIIITTHSPELISRLPVDTLRIVENQNGITEIGPISEIQRTAIVEQIFSSGELLRIEGLRRQPNVPELIET
jgi:predicted ATPase